MNTHMDGICSLHALLQTELRPIETKFSLYMDT